MGTPLHSATIGASHQGAAGDAGAVHGSSHGPKLHGVNHGSDSGSAASSDKEVIRNRAARLGGSPGRASGRLSEIGRAHV